jgi:hypothetical protein
MMRRLVLILVWLVLGLGLPAQAATYYVATTGSEANDCTAAQNSSTPKLRISSGVACATTAGDTVYVRAGTYTNTADRIDSADYTVASGSSGNHITIRAYPSETVTIQPPDGKHAVRLTVGSPSYITIGYFILDGINQTAVPASGGPALVYMSTAVHNVIIEWNEIKDNSANGIEVSNNNGAAYGNTIQSNTIHGNGRLNETNTGYGIYTTTGDTTIVGNVIYGNNGYGVHHNPSSGGDNVVISGNTLYGNAVHGVNMGNGTTSTAILVARGANALVYNNLVYENQAGIVVYYNSSGAGVYNNTVVNNTNDGIWAQGYASTPTFRNNISYLNGGNNYMDYGDDGVCGGMCSATEDHNLFGTDPSFVDAGSDNYALQSGSVARDAGTTVAAVTIDYLGVSRPQNGVYDIGAYEFSVTTAPAQYGFGLRRRRPR